MYREQAAEVRSRLAIPKFVIRLALISVLLMAVTVTLIHSQPFEDKGFHADIFGDQCSSACFMGIQAGVTTTEQARDLLEKQHLVSQWIESPPSDDTTTGELRWR